MKVCSKRFSRKLKDINEGLYCKWNGLFNKWQILHRDPNTARIRKVRYLQTKAGIALEANDNDRRVADILYSIRTTIPWDLVRKYDTTEQIMNHVDADNKRYEDYLAAEKEARTNEIIKDTMALENIDKVFVDLGA